MAWKTVKIGTFLKESKILSTEPDADKRITVRLSVEWVEKRSLRNDSKWATKYYIRRAGQFIYGQQNLHKGAFGIIPEELDGFESSWDLPAFDIDTEKCRPEWLMYFFINWGFYRTLEKLAKGIGSKRIYANQLFDIDIPLPEILEQCSILEWIKQSEMEVLKFSAIGYKNIELIKSLRSSVLQDAIQGKLVPQNPEDEPASVLLEQIRKEKSELRKTGKFKKQKEFSPITKEEIPFELPTGWEWVRLGWLLPDYQNWVSSRGDSQGSMVTVLRLADIKNQSISLSNTREIIINEKDILKYWIKKNDILITRVNWSTDIVWQFILSENSIDAIYCDHFIRLRIKDSWINPRYLILVSKSVMNRQRISELFITTAGQKTVNQQHINSLLIPIPPISEQYRIIEKVEELLVYCDTLEASVWSASERSGRLLESVLGKVFSS